MRKNVLTAVLMLILMTALLVSFTGCGNDRDDRIAQLEQENAQLQRQLDALTGQLEALGQGVGLSDWSMHATAWSSSNGANVTISATPLRYEEDQSAAFLVTLEGVQVANVPCQWDGSVYTASVDLNAADGYCYYIQLIAADSAVTNIEVNTPIMPTNDSLINLETSLNAFCSVYLEDCQVAQDTLTLSGGHGQIQLPQLPLASGSITCVSAQLVLEHNGQAVSTQTLELPPMGETNGCLIDVDGIQFPLPQMQDDEQLDLWLEVTCSDDQLLRGYAGSWYYMAGQLSLAVG